MTTTVSYNLIFFYNILRYFVTNKNIFKQITLSRKASKLTINNVMKIIYIYMEDSLLIFIYLKNKIMFLVYYFYIIKKKKILTTR